MPAVPSPTGVSAGTPRLRRGGPKRRRGPRAWNGHGNGRPRPQLPKTDLANTGGVTVIALVALLVLAVIYTLYFGRALLIPLTAAVLAGYLLRPVIRMLSRSGVPTMAGTILVFALFVGTVGTGGYLLAPPAARWVERLPETFEQAEERLRSVFSSIGAVREAVDDVSSAPTREAGEPEVVTVAPRPLSARILDGARDFLVGGTLATFMLFFLLSSGETFLPRTVSMLPTLRQKKMLVRISRGIEHDLSKYMFTTSMINVGLGIAVGFALSLIGVPNAMLWGVVVALLNYVPYLGAIVGVFILGLVAIASLESIGRALLAPLAYIVLNGLEAYAITPHIVGRRFSLNPVAVFLAVAFWGWLWGIPGALLAVPILTAMAIVCSNIEKLRPIAVFLHA